MAPDKKTRVDSKKAFEWAKDVKLSWKIVYMLQEKDELRRAFWKTPGETSTKHNRSTASQVIAAAILNDPDLGFSVEKQNSFEDQKKLFATSVKQQIRKMELSWRAARDRMGATGAGLSSAADIGKGTPLEGTWALVCKRTPWFYELSEMIGEKMDVGDKAVGNSASEIDLSCFEPSAHAASEPEDGSDFPDDDADESQLSPYARSKRQRSSIPRADSRASKLKEGQTSRRIRSVAETVKLQIKESAEKSAQAKMERQREYMEHRQKMEEMRLAHERDENNRKRQHELELARLQYGQRLMYHAPVPQAHGSSISNLLNDLSPGPSSLPFYDP